LTFPGGATRSSKKPRYDLIEPSFLEGIATVLSEGAAKYGVDNWKRGGPEFAGDILNHLIEHLLLWRSGDRSEPHLRNAACNLMFLTWYSIKFPHFFPPTGPSYLPPQAKAKADEKQEEIGFRDAA
jgi:hypothetical protein